MCSLSEVVSTSALAENNGVGLQEANNELSGNHLWFGRGMLRLKLDFVVDARKHVTCDSTNSGEEMPSQPTQYPRQPSETSRTPLHPSTGDRERTFIQGGALI